MKKDKQETPFSSFTPLSTAVKRNRNILSKYFKVYKIKTIRKEIFYKKKKKLIFLHIISFLFFSLCFPFHLFFFSSRNWTVQCVPGWEQLDKWFVVLSFQQDDCDVDWNETTLVNWIALIWCGKKYTVVWRGSGSGSASSNILPFETGFSI